ncbi:MAG: hypothetical protein ACO29Y_05345 [Holophagaceae bacterium]|jgi:glyceraldehyde-3-phosphate dehydrogenase/erythrose-4-phosphate dehydrogenase
MTKTVHIVGTGTIGLPLISLFAHYREALGIDEVTFHKNSVVERPKIQDLLTRGAKLVCDADKKKAFEAYGTPATYTHEEILSRDQIVVIDCSPKGNEMKESLYQHYEKNALGFLAQGSEFNFGKMYARGINDETIDPLKDKWIQVVSCNTHNISAIISTLALTEGSDNLEEGNFVCMRRSNDISQVKDFSPSPQVGSHKDGKFGTHHARDAHHLFKTKGIDLQLFSSAVKLPTQYMHTLWFDLRLKRATNLEKIMTYIKANDRIATTEKKDANAIFSFGRDHGYFGRIMNQTVIPTATLTMPHDRRLVGMCFTPQDANSLLSSLAAAVRYHHPQTWETKLQVLRPLFFDEV